MNVRMSVDSSIFFVVGFPAPCPALLYTRNRIGFFWYAQSAIFSCRAAANFSECNGLTRSS